MKEKLTVKEIASELIALRSFIIGLAGKDDEGEYRPEFAKRILSASREQPIDSFTTSDDFLSHLRKA